MMYSILCAFLIPYIIEKILTCWSKGFHDKNKSNRTTMHPLGVLSHWNIYCLIDVFKFWEAMVGAVVVAEVVTAVVIADLY